MNSFSSLTLVVVLLSPLGVVRLLDTGLASVCDQPAGQAAVFRDVQFSREVSLLPPHLRGVPRA